MLHAAALRALGDDLRVGVNVLIEGAEETGRTGIEELVRARPDLAAADAIVIADAGNRAVGRPTLTTSLRGMAKILIEVRRWRARSTVASTAVPRPTRWPR